MVTPRELAIFLSGNFGVPVKTALAVDRELREAGLRSSSGRGTSAAIATPKDAALLLIALAGAQVFAPAVAGAAETVEKYSTLPADDGALVRPFTECSSLPRLARLASDHLFGEALSALVESEIAASSTITVTLIAPWPAAEIFIVTDSRSFGACYSRPPASDDHAGFKRLFERNAGAFGTPDFRERREFSHRTIVAVGALLAGDAA